MPGLQLFLIASGILSEQLVTSELTEKTRDPQNRATVSANLRRKFGEIWVCGLEKCQRTDRQTNRLTDTLMAVLRTLGRSNEPSPCAIAMVMLTAL